MSENIDTSAQESANLSTAKNRAKHIAVAEPTDDERSNRQAPKAELDPNASDASDALRIVGIGASAGGLDALERFFQRVPLDSGMAFVIVQHLAPDFNSLMNELLTRHTKIPIFEVKDGVKVEPNTIYLLPPRANMIYVNGLLRLSERGVTDVLNLPIDLFFRSLAQGIGASAIGVVLSGTGSDGSQGVKDLAQAGALIAVQEPSSALFDGMPRNAINTQSAQIVARAEELPQRLLDHLRASQLQADGVSPIINNEETLEHASYLQEENERTIIFSLLQNHFQIDFAQYKPETVLRRIQRRIDLKRVANATDYIQLLQKEPAELDALYRDLLIDVTRFFRDPDAFAKLHVEIEQIVKTASMDDGIRIWVAGCATGEEAYSLAMLFTDALEAHPHPVRVQIFATDAHPESIAFASKGCYPADRVANVPAKLAEKYLIQNQEGDSESYNMAESIRQMVVFAQHNLLQDPPFTRLSLVTCRNVLIYMKPHIQDRILAQFFFGLKSGGTLFLGPSEQLSRLENEFQTTDRRWRIFTKQAGVQMPAAFSSYQGHRLTSRTDKLPSRTENSAKLNLYEALIDSQMPPCLLLNEQYDLVRTFGDAGKYLKISGNPSYQILDMVELELSTALRAGLHRAFQENKAVTYSGVRVPKNIHAPQAEIAHGELAHGELAHDELVHGVDNDSSDNTNAASAAEPFMRLRVTVKPVTSPKIDARYALVSLEEIEDELSIGAHRSLTRSAEDAGQRKTDEDDAGSAMQDDAVVEFLQTDLDTDLDKASRYQLTILEEELAHTKEYLQTTIEELETTNEEMQSTNEELIASNEELQSTNEELHSVNEELYTVNTEYQRKIDELQILSDDMTNLRNSTKIATLFLDNDLRIRHFTPEAANIFRLLPHDLQRPIDHLRPEIDLEQEVFINFLHAVLQDGVPIEAEVVHKENEYFLLRILPYNAYDGSIDGVVVTLVNITSQRQAQSELVTQEKLLSGIANLTPVYTYLVNLADKSTIYKNRNLPILMGYDEQEAEALNNSFFASIIHPDDVASRAEVMERLSVTAHGESIQSEYRLRHKDGSWHWYMAQQVVYERHEDGSLKLILGAIQDITQMRQAENELLAQQKLLTSITNLSPATIYLYNNQDEHFSYINRDIRKELGYSPAEIQEMVSSVIQSVGHPEDLALIPQRVAERNALKPDEAVENYLRLRTKDGGWRWYFRQEVAYERDEDGTVKSTLGIAMDVTAQKQVETKLHESEARYRNYLDKAVDAVYLFDTSFNIVYANEQACRELGYPHKELLTLNASDINQSYDPETVSKRIQAVPVGETIPRKTTHVRKDGSTFPVESIGVKLIQNDQEYLLFTARNMSHQTEAQETIIRLNQQLTEANTALTAERDQVITSLMESEERYRVHVDATSAVLWVSNAAGHFIAPQNSWSQYTGQTWPEQAKDAWLDMFHEADRGAIQAAWQQGLMNRETFTVEARLWSAELEQYCLTKIKAVSVIENNEIFEWVGTIVDVNASGLPSDLATDLATLRGHRMRLLYEITSHIATDVEIQLAKALRLAAEALNSQYAAIGRIDDDTYLVRHLYASGTDMEIGQALPLDETYCSIILEQDDVLVVNNMAESAYSDRICYKNMGFDSYIGTTITVDGKPYGNVCFFGESPKSPPYTKADEDFVRLLAVWIGFAIERLRIDKAHELQSISLEAMNAELARSNQDLDTFVYIASHDLKEPLRGINQYAQFLHEDYAAHIDEAGQSMMIALREQSTRAGQLIEDLRFYSRIGRTSLGLEEIDLTELINGVLAQIQARLNEHEVTVEIADDLPTVIYNHARLSTIFQNLLVNAIKYNDKQKKLIEVGVTYAPKPPCLPIEQDSGDIPAEDLVDVDLLAQLSYGAQASDSLVDMPWLPEGTPIFYVQDNGIGIEERNIGRIFGMFKRLHGHGEYGGGTGAGLPIVRRILERNNGHIWVETTLNEGTKFNFTLGNVPTAETEQ